MVSWSKPSSSWSHQIHESQPITFFFQSTFFAVGYLFDSQMPIYFPVSHEGDNNDRFPWFLYFLNKGYTLFISFVSNRSLSGWSQLK